MCEFLIATFHQKVVLLEIAINTYKNIANYTNNTNVASPTCKCDFEKVRVLQMLRDRFSEEDGDDAADDKAAFADPMDEDWTPSKK